MLSSNEIRQQFIDFFKERGHDYKPSSSVVPHDDPTLLFTNAGMNQFKNIFLGQVPITYKRAVNSQKCIRAGGKHNDLEEVGRDGYHHTFFEMLGNWSFGDYYKKEAIVWAWELFTQEWKLPKELLHATVHTSDHDAHELWKSLTDIDPTHITYHGDKDNFWEMGETGPCGPCSEINIDRGIEFCDKQHVPGHECKVNGDCQRYMELWNLVFIQYNRTEDRELHPLQHKYVDTGMGLERITQVLQGKSTNYQTDAFLPILEKVAELSKVPYTEETGVSHRIIADHIRCLSFAIADGGMPSNEGRGYVLRRILRRAARHGRKLNFHEPFLYQLVDTLVEMMGHHFTELKVKAPFLKMVIKAEEDRFNQTLDKGLVIFEDIVKNTVGNEISGADAFMLYDTYGFPFDLTVQIAEERNLTVNEADFKEEMEKQRTRARESSKFTSTTEELNWTILIDNTKTEFVGYDLSMIEAKILRYTIGEDGILRIVLDKTPFYAESGGQVGDNGVLKNNESEIRILDVRKEHDLTIHYCEILKGGISELPYEAVLDSYQRLRIARNHTATHLIHAALRQVLGEHVQQKGSLVSADALRFDFTHFYALKDEELQKVESIVNEQIRACQSVEVQEMGIDDAKKLGAMALFGEKYGDHVRVVKVGDFSMELCGGTHLHNSGEIGSVKITSEASIASGVRRIEAITGDKVELYIRLLEQKQTDIASALGVPELQVLPKIDRMQIEIKDLLAEVDTLTQKAAAIELEELLNKAMDIDGMKVVASRFKVKNVKELSNLADVFKVKLKSGIGVLFSEIEGKVSLLVVSTPDLMGKYPAGKLAGKIAELVDGKGGGKPDQAMAGGKSVEKIDEAIAQVAEIIKSFKI